MACRHNLSNFPVSALCGLGLLSCLAVTALLAEVLSPYSPAERFHAFLPPAPPYWLGTDDVGHDILSQLIFASRISLTVGFTAAVASVCLGTMIGILAGYFSGWTREWLSGFIDTILLIPFLPLMITLAAYLDPSLSNIVLVIALLGWCSTARVVQSRVLQLREMPFVEALQAVGISHTRIMLRHILPNISEVIAAKFVLAVSQVMLSEAALSFLGLGDPCHISWGGMLYYAFHRGGFVNNLWLWYLPPGLCIVLATLGFMLLGFYLERSKDDAQQEGGEPA